MSGACQINPPTLINLARKSLMNSLIEFFSSRKYESTSDFILLKKIIKTSLSAELKDDIMNELIQLDGVRIWGDLPKWCSMKIIELFISVTTKKLKFGFNNFQYDVDKLLDFDYKIMTLIYPYLPTLEDLEFNFYHLSCSDISFLFSRSEEFGNDLKLKNLKIKVNHQIDFKFLGSILISCPHLTDLQIFVDNSKKLDIPLSVIEFWPEHAKLNILKFDMNISKRFSPQIAELILKKFPNLVIFNLGNNLGNAILDSIIAPRLASNLIHLTDTNTKLDSIVALLKCCPKIGSIKLISPEQGVVVFLGNFQSLNEISLERFNTEELNDLLKTYGPKILSLSLKHGENFNLTFIIEKCPKLKFLTLKYNLYMIVEDRVILHENMKHFILYPRISKNLDKILEGFIAIEKFEIQEWTSDPDNLLTKLIPAWQKLKSLSFVEAPLLTIESLILIAQNCPQLEEILPHKYFRYNDMFFTLLRIFLKKTPINARLRIRNSLYTN